MITQEQAVKKHLLSGKTLTSYDAFTLYGCTRLSAKIFDLRHKYKYNIEGKRVTKKNRYGKPVSYCEYKLIEEDI